MPWGPDYATTSDLKSYLRIGDTADDLELKLAITGASRAIDHATNRQFGMTDTPGLLTEDRQYEAKWSPRHGRWKARIDDVMTTAGLIVAASGSAIAATAYQLLPLNADLKGRPWEQILVDSVTSPQSGSGPSTVEVTATYGWSAVPDTIKEATLLQASRFFTRRDAPFGVAGSPDIGSEVRLLAKVDADVEVLVRAYRRDWPMVL